MFDFVDYYAMLAVCPWDIFLNLVLIASVFLIVFMFLNS